MVIWRFQANALIEPETGWELLTQSTLSVTGSHSGWICSFRTSGGKLWVSISTGSWCMVARANQPALITRRQWEKLVGRSAAPFFLQSEEVLSETISHHVAGHGERSPWRLESQRV